MLDLPIGADDPEPRVGADAHAQPLDEASAFVVAEGKVTRPLYAAEANRAMSMTTGDTLGALGEDRLRAPSVDASQSAAMTTEQYRPALP